MKTIKNFILTKEILNQAIYFKFSSSNTNIFYIITSNAITDKCTLVRDPCKRFRRYLILNDWKHISL